MRALTGVAAFLAAASASAAEPDYSTKETRALMHAYAKCVVTRQPKLAGAAILANADNATIVRRYGRLIIEDCLAKQVRQTTRMSFKGDLYRYALADALVSRELAAAPPPDLGGVARRDHHDPGPAPEKRKLGRKRYEAAVKAHGEAAAFHFLSRYGECVVRVDPAGSKALLLTVPDSPEETSRFNALRPAFSTCLAAGEKLAFGRTTLRGTVAINYYRLAHAARTAGKATG